MADSAPVQQAKQEIKDLADRDADSVDSDVRYMAYGARLRTALRAGHRYIAYVRIYSLRVCARADSGSPRPVMSVKRFDQLYLPHWSRLRTGSHGCISSGEFPPLFSYQ